MVIQNYQKKEFIIYVHRNKVNGKCYVGQTCQIPEDRWGANGNGYSRQTVFYNAILKYGWDNFEHIILEEHIPPELVDERESYWAIEYNALVPNGYTILTGQGESILTSEEYSKIRSKQMKEVWKNPEYREKIKIKRQEEWQDPEVREKCLKNLDRSGKGAKKMAKKVLCVETGEIYESTRDAERKTGICHNNICQVCNGDRKTAKGFHWEYVKE